MTVQTLRILYDHQAMSLQNAGGISAYFFHLIQQLTQNQDVDATLFLGQSASVLPFESLDGIKCHIKHSRGRMAPGYVRYLVNEIANNTWASASGRFDIYHPTYYRCLPLVRSHAIVVTHHDCVLELFPHVVKSARIGQAVKREQFARANAVICVSANSRDDLLRFYPIPPEKTHVIHLGVTPPSIGSLPLQAQTERPYILYVGSRKLCKNFDGLIRAFGASRLRRDFMLICAGGGPFNSEELQLLKNAGLLEQVVLLPWVGNEELGALYKHARAFVYPSLYEGFGLPPLEAMAIGTVAVVSKVSSIPEVCGEGAIYFDPSSIESMVDSLERACYDERSRFEARRNGALVAAKYTWEECARKTLEVYRQLR